LLVQILTPDELEPAYDGRVSLIDSESIDVSDDKNMKMRITRSMQKAYDEALHDFKEEIRTYCTKRGVDFISVSTDEPVEKLELVMKQAKATKEKEEKQEMYFRNGKLEEAFMGATSVEALRDIIRDREYLIPEIKLLSVNLLNGEEDMLCQYMSGSIVTGGAAEVEPGMLFPKKSTISDSICNLHVVPIVYAGIKYGYVVVGYTSPVVYNRHLKQFCHCLALWCKVHGGGRMAEQSVAMEETEEVLFHEEIPEIKSVGRSEETIVGRKNNLMHKIKLERIFYFEAQEKHIYAMTKSGAYEVSLRLFEIEEKLSGHRFMRISKSIIMNLDKVIGVKVEEDRTLRAFFSKNQSVRVTRSYIKEFRERIGM
jgi:hypothetical protein